MAAVGLTGKKNATCLYLLPYLELGWSAINVEYRNGHQAPAPAAVEDARCALRWLTYHARDYATRSSEVRSDGHVGRRASVVNHRHVAGEQCLRSPVC